MATPLSRLGFGRSVLAVLLAAGGGLETPLPAAQNIRAYQDAAGRVVFVNEAEPGPLRAALTTATPAPHIDRLIEGAAERHQVDPQLIRALVQVESGFNPRAVSSKGAEGLMQLIPATARRFGTRDTFDPQANLDGGVRYLRHLLDLYNGDLELALAAYNAGENAVGRHNGVPPYRETQNYLKKIFALYPTRRSVRPESGIVRFVDRRGVVHFSNTGMP